MACKLKLMCCLKCPRLVNAAVRLPRILQETLRPKTTLQWRVAATGCPHNEVSKLEAGAW